MLTYFFVAFENIFYGILIDLEIAGKIIKFYQAQLLFCEMRQHLKHSLVQNLCIHLLTIIMFQTIE